MSLSITFNALSDKTRRKILELLKSGEKPARELGKNFDITPPSLSHHLKVLKNAGLVSSRRKGQEIIYSLNLSVFEDVSKTIINFFK